MLVVAFAVVVVFDAAVAVLFVVAADVPDVVVQAQNVLVAFVSDTNVVAGCCFRRCCGDSMCYFCACGFDALGGGDYDAHVVIDVDDRIIVFAARLPLLLRFRC